MLSTFCFQSRSSDSSQAFHARLERHAINRRLHLPADTITASCHDAFAKELDFFLFGWNTAVYAKRVLGAAGQVGFATRVGHDPLSAGFLDAAQTHGIDTGTIDRDQSRTLGIYSVTTDAAGERSFHYWREQSAARVLDAAKLVPARILYVSGITLAILSPARRQALLAQFVRHTGAAVRLVREPEGRPDVSEQHEILALARRSRAVFFQAK